MKRVGHRSVFDPNGADDRLSTAALTRLLVRKRDIQVIAAGRVGPQSFEQPRVEGGISGVPRSGESETHHRKSGRECPLPRQVRRRALRG
jgi:hypothetical protein